MNWKEAGKALQTALATIYTEGEAQAITIIVLEETSGYDRQQLFLKSNEELTTEQRVQWQELQQRLLQHEPVQYITHNAPFYGLELYVDENVLIPRPETEELVQWIVDDVKATGRNVFTRSNTEADVTTELKILDICTGSGCIALALKKTMPKAEVWGCDVSEEALNVARRNGSHLNIRVDFQGVNFLDEAQQKFLPSVDIIACNPPYVPQKDKNTMQANVLQYEPHLALFVPDEDALIFYKALAHFGKKRLHAKGLMYLEIHENLAKEVADLFQQEGYKNVVIKKDMQGKERMVRVSKDV